MAGYYNFFNLEGEKYYLERICDKNDEENVIALTP